MNSDTISTIYSRHSMRNFDPNCKISRDTQRMILDSGLQAPSAKNRQPWSFIILDQDKSIKYAAEILKNKLSMLKSGRLSRNIEAADIDMAFETAEIIKNVSFIVFACYVRDDSERHDETVDWAINAQAFEVSDLLSIGACVENMMLTAESLGIGSLWIGDILYAERELAEFLKAEHPIVCAAAFGKEKRKYTSRFGVEEKARWLSPEGFGVQYSEND